MSEMVSLPTEHISPMVPEYQPPAELIVHSDAARQVFADFMWRYEGSMDYVDRALRRGAPRIERTSYDGDKVISYDSIHLSGYTGLGSLVHVRLDPTQEILQDKFLVAIANLKDGTLREEYVEAVDYDSTVARGLEMRLRLGHSACASWPAEYAPNIRQAGQKLFYSPGFHRREEQLLPIDGLYRDAMALGGSALTHAHLRLV